MGLRSVAPVVRSKQPPVGQADRCHLGGGADTFVFVYAGKQGSHTRGRVGVDAILPRHLLAGCGWACGR
jgi:hypothetical protein